jgi:glycosyltransferase involved in cell wall biosynthesis
MDGVLQVGLSRMTEAGVKLTEVPMRRSPHPSDLAVLISLYKYLREKGPFDLVHGHSSKGGALARLSRLLGGPKAVYTPHAFVTVSPHFGKVEIVTYGIAERVLSLLTAALIAVSEDEAREALHLGYPEGRIRIIPNAIDLDKIHGETGEALRARLGIAPDVVAIGFVGRFSPQKAPLLLLEAFAKVALKHPQSSLVMVGEGPLRPLLQKRAQELGLEGRVLWPGFLEGRVAMRAFDIFALPSNYEGFPYVLLEAMAEGLPVVATRVGGVEMAIREGENGLVVPVGDTESFAQALDLLLSDEQTRNKFGGKSRQHVQRFGLDKMVEAVLALYSGLIKR